MVSEAAKEKLLYKYVYDSLANEYNMEGQSNSLADLYNLAEVPFKPDNTADREDQVASLLSKIPSHMHGKILAVENLRADLREFSTDCDEEFFVSTDRHLVEVLSHFKKDNPEEMRIRNKLYNLRYDVEEQLNPTVKVQRFNLLKQMVHNIKRNKGSFDHDPLNITAKRMEYFMKDIPVEERLSLLDMIIKKTKGSGYNYSSYKSKLKQEKAEQDAENKYFEKEDNQYRYEQIMKKELANASSNSERVELYKEALELVNDQDWSRSTKFQTKINICNSLISIYRQEGMTTELASVMRERDKFSKSLDNTKLYAAKKGYTYK